MANDVDGVTREGREGFVEGYVQTHSCPAYSGRLAGELEKLLPEAIEQENNKNRKPI